MAVNRLTGSAVVGIVAMLIAAVPSAAQPPTNPEQDAEFYRLLTSPTAAGLNVWNPALARAQGLLACQRQDNGIDGLTAVHMLQSEGPYSFDVAKSIVAAANVVYCRQHLGF